MFDPVSALMKISDLLAARRIARLYNTFPGATAIHLRCGSDFCVFANDKLITTDNREIKHFHYEIWRISRQSSVAIYGIDDPHLVADHVAILMYDYEMSNVSDEFKSNWAEEGF